MKRISLVLILVISWSEMITVNINEAINNKNNLQKSVLVKSEIISCPSGKCFR